MTIRQALLRAFHPSQERDRMAFRMSNSYTQAQAEDLLRAVKAMNGSLLVDVDKFIKRKPK